MEYIVHKTNLKAIEEGYKTRGEIFKVKRAELRQTRSGKDYYDLVLYNSLGESPVKLWDVTEVISEGEFLSVYMTGVVDPKWGEQWKIKICQKSSYTGDEGFEIEEESFDISRAFSEISRVNLEDSTCKSLYFTAVNMFFGVRAEVSFLECPAWITYFSERGGLLKYVSLMLEALPNSSTYLNLDLVKTCILLHHLGSTEFFVPEDGDRFSISYKGKLSSPEQEISAVLNTIRIEAQNLGKPVDAAKYLVVEKICQAMFTDHQVCVEATYLQGLRNTAVVRGKMKKIFSKDPGKLLVYSKQGYVINTKYLNENVNVQKSS